MGKYLTFFALIRRCLLWDRANTRQPMDLTDIVLTKADCRRDGMIGLPSGEKRDTGTIKRGPPQPEGQGGQEPI